VIEILVELSRENPPLARAELDGALLAEGGRSRATPLPTPSEALVAGDVPDLAAAVRLALRLALGRRVLLAARSGSTSETVQWFEHQGKRPGTAAIRPFGSPNAPLAARGLDEFARAFRSGGGRVELDDPSRRYFVARVGTLWWVAEEVAVVNRRELSARRMPLLPFRRPVSLPPKLGRVAVNLGAVRPGARVLDPFAGTGALALESALLGAQVTAVDRDATMVRGAIQNLAAFGRSFENALVADAGDAARRYSGPPFDGVVTDPPYGRSSGMAGEERAVLVQRVLEAWSPHLGPSARVSVVLPGGPDPLSPPWERVVSVPDRVHRSLTREFRVYARP